MELSPPIMYTFLAFSTLLRVALGILFFLVKRIGAFVAPASPLALSPSAIVLSAFISIAVV